MLTWASSSSSSSYKYPQGSVPVYEACIPFRAKGELRDGSLHMLSMTQSCRHRLRLSPCLACGSGASRPQCRHARPSNRATRAEPIRQYHGPSGDTEGLLIRSVEAPAATGSTDFILSRDKALCRRRPGSPHHRGQRSVSTPLSLQQLSKPLPRLMHREQQFPLCRRKPSSHTA